MHAEHLTASPEEKRPASLGFEGVVALTGFVNETSDSTAAGPRNFFRDLVEEHPDEIFMCDPFGTITYVNRAWISVRGLSADHVIGRPIWEFRETPEEQEAGRAVIDVVRGFLTADQPFLAAKRWEKLNGENRYMEYVTRGLFENGQLVMFIGTSRDRTEQQNTELAVRSTNRKLEESNRDLKEFAYVASHDLQEPLRKILAFTERAIKHADGKFDETTMDYLNRSRNAAERMSKLINDLLTFSRVGAATQSMQSCDLNEVLAGVLSDLEVALTNANATVDCAGLPTLVADPTQMRQLFQNLIGNALKFRKGDVPTVVTITAGKSIDVDGNAFWEFRVADNGIGFEPEYADKIFAVFQRLHARHEFEGSGVGLSVCRRIVDRHGGSITAEGTKGEGATFVISLPAEQRL